MGLCSCLGRLISTGISIAIFVVGVILFLTSYATPDWYIGQVNGTNTKGGLWETCMGNNCTKHVDWDNFTGELLAVSIMMTIVLGFLAVAALLYGLNFLHCCCKQTGLTIAGLQTFSGVMIIASVLTYRFGYDDKYEDVYGGELDYGFALACVSCAIFIVNGALAKCMVPSDDEDE